MGNQPGSVVLLPGGALSRPRLRLIGGIHGVPSIVFGTYWFESLPTGFRVKLPTFIYLNDGDTR